MNNRFGWPLLVALEGPSGIGKTTLLSGVASRLLELDLSFEVVSNNDSGRWGAVIRDLAVSPDRALTLTLATASARAELRESADGPQLCDRYVLSTLVYQRFAGIALDYLYSVNQPLLSSSVTFVLRLGVADLAARRRLRLNRTDWFKGKLEIATEIEFYEQGAAFLVGKGHEVIFVDAAKDASHVATEIASKIAAWERRRAGR